MGGADKRGMGLWSQCRVKKRQILGEKQEKRATLGSRERDGLRMLPSLGGDDPTLRICRARQSGRVGSETRKKRSDVGCHGVTEAREGKHGGATRGRGREVGSGHDPWDTGDEKKQNRIPGRDGLGRVGEGGRDEAKWRGRDGGMITHEGCWSVRS